MKKTVLVHKGEKDTKYEIQIEGYALSALESMCDGEHDSENGNRKISFFGERNRNQYVIWGIGQESDATYFEHCEMLSELSCVRTEHGIEFCMAEEEACYGIRGYEVFYSENAGMQDCLLKPQRQSGAKRQYGRQTGGHAGVRNSVGEMTVREKEIVRRTGRLQGWISMQMNVLLVLLCAMVITSMDSYGKLQELGENTREVLVTMENETEKELQESRQQDRFAEEKRMQEQDRSAEEGIQEKSEQQDVTMEEHIQETQQQPDMHMESGQAGKETEVIETVKTETWETEEKAQDNTQNDGGQEEALSRELTRYYQVEKGDTLYTICREVYGDLSLVKRVCEVNGIDNPDEIGYGQRLILP